MTGWAPTYIAGGGYFVFRVERIFMYSSYSGAMKSNKNGKSNNFNLILIFSLKIAKNR